MASEFFETLKRGDDEIALFKARQKNAATIALLGPAGSGKSTLVTELLPPESVKLLSRNIGDAGRETLIPTRIMLNSNFAADEIVIECKRRPAKSGYPDFFDSVKTVLTDLIYERRDEFDIDMIDFELGDKYDAVDYILNPANRSFHAYGAVNDELDTELFQIFEDIYESIVLLPTNINIAANAAFREMKKTKATAHKKEAYERVVEERFCAKNLYSKKLEQWYGKFETLLLRNIDRLFTDPDARRFIGKIGGGERQAADLIERLYEPDSPYSLVFDEIIYAVRPSDGFIDAFSREYPDRAVKLNVLDTPGLTRSSTLEGDISHNMDVVLKRGGDALLFLCAADEQPAIYEMCVKLLGEKKPALARKIVAVCRTKADITIRNIMRDTWKRENGTNRIDANAYHEYVSKAKDAFERDYIDEPQLGEKGLGFGGSDVRYISLASDSTGELENVFDILFDIVVRTDKMYGRDRTLRLESVNTVCPIQAAETGIFPDMRDGSIRPVGVIFDGDGLTNIAAQTIVMKHAQNGNQYTKYIKDVGAFYHGRSVNSFRQKLAVGVGYETDDVYYDNFKLFIPQMVRRWLKETLDQKAIIRSFSISYRNLKTELSDERKRKLEVNFVRLLGGEWETLLTDCAEYLTYGRLEGELAKSFAGGGTYSDKFRSALAVLEAQFSKEQYWRCLRAYLEVLGDRLLQKLYIFD